MDFDLDAASLLKGLLRDLADADSDKTDAKSAENPKKSQEKSVAGKTRRSRRTTVGKTKKSKKGGSRAGGYAVVISDGKVTKTASGDFTEDDWNELLERHSLSELLRRKLAEADANEGSETKKPIAEPKSPTKRARLEKESKKVTPKKAAELTPSERRQEIRQIRAQLKTLLNRLEELESK
ncbi:MAG: hypothetical protein AAF517_22435 [Planctomycetota bacterium]